MYITITDAQETDRRYQKPLSTFFNWVYFSGTYKVRVSRFLKFERVSAAAPPKKPNSESIQHPSHEWMEFKS